MKTADVLAAFNDLKSAIALSSIDSEGHMTLYENNGTGKAIVLAVDALMVIREDGDGDV